jgi:uncharacterized protein (DUF433 family)/DNA-binding transcriptional MerR regulator
MSSLATRKTRAAPGAAHLGVFSPRRAGVLAGVSGDQIGQWARYGLIRPTLYRGRPANRYAFYDVAEAIVVHWLRERGFSYDEIHSAIGAASDGNRKWPLLEAPLGVAQHAIEHDRGVIAIRTSDGQYVEIGRPGGQFVLPPELFEFAGDMLRSGGWLADRLGLTRIEVNPEKLGGAPSVRGHRWPVERVARIAADPPGRAFLLAEYDLDEQDVEESIRWTTAAAAL